jgi:hypothetical protein
VLPAVRALFETFLIPQTEYCLLLIDAIVAMSSSSPVWRTFSNSSNIRSNFRLQVSSYRRRRSPSSVSSPRQTVGGVRGVELGQCTERVRLHPQLFGDPIDEVQEHLPRRLGIVGWCQSIVPPMLQVARVERSFVGGKLVHDLLFAIGGVDFPTMHPRREPGRLSPIDPLGQPLQIHDTLDEEFLDRIARHPTQLPDS